MSASGTNLPFRNVRRTAAFGGNPDIEATSPDDRVDPIADAASKRCLSASVPKRLMTDGQSNVRSARVD